MVNTTSREGILAASRTPVYVARNAVTADKRTTQPTTGRTATRAGLTPQPTNQPPASLQRPTATPAPTEPRNPNAWAVFNANQLGLTNNWGSTGLAPNSLRRPNPVQATVPASAPASSTPTSRPVTTSNTPSKDAIAAANAVRNLAAGTQTAPLPGMTWDDERGGWAPSESIGPVRSIGNTLTPVTPPTEATPPREGWVWDDNRGGWIPAPKDEGTVINPDGTMTLPDGSVVPVVPGANDGSNAPTTETPEVETPEVETPEAEVEPEWSLENDPIYLQALQEAQNAFNLNRINALGTLQYQTTGINRELRNRIPAAEDMRRRLAGNFAARGMGGGRFGALYRTEAAQNAVEQNARNNLREQIAELNRQFTGQFGTEGSDWTATLFGQQARENAIQRALQLLIPRFTSVGA